MEKNLLIIYPHWPPSNLTGVHRPRLIANSIFKYGWHPVVLTVDSKYYEEQPDFDMIKTVRPEVEVIYTKAWKVPKPRIFGDIGIRGFKFLYKKALEIIDSRKIDFIWIPIPSFYTALLGRLLHDKTGVKYGIDYIDPWVRDISGRKNIRSVLSNLVARILEPYAIKKAALITGVAQEYFLPALDRTFGEDKRPETLAFPYGFDIYDHQQEPSEINLPWEGCGCRPFLYAGAFLPNSRYFFDVFFEALSEIKHDLGNIKLFFIGSGAYSPKEIALKYGVDGFVEEINQRYPYLQILKMLELSGGVMVIGSTEKHYTASKIFQSLLSKRPVFAIFHKESTTVQVLSEAHADNYLALYSPEISREELKARVLEKFYAFVKKQGTWQPDLDSLTKYSSAENARVFASKLDEIIR